MNLGTRKRGHSSLMLSSCQVDKRIIEISHLQTDEAHRGKGLATRLLESVCEQADKERVVLLIKPDNEKLELWYTKFGFETFQVIPAILMARPPRGAIERKDPNGKDGQSEKRQS